MEKLKVGDVVYLKEHSRWSNNINYAIATVERLTTTQAVISGGKKLVNEPIQDWYDKSIGYREYGNHYHYTHWHILTDEIREEIKTEQERRKICNWFEKRKFSDQEKAIVYAKFKELNLIEETNDSIRK